MVKEAIMTIISAWSVAFIALFLICVTRDAPISPARVRVVAALLVGAITGTGWLVFRHRYNAQGN